MGCKITHLFGVPMIALSFPMLLFNRKKAVALFGCGWFLQFLGHFVFEHNKPVLLTRGRSPLTLLSALVFVGQEWVDTLQSVTHELRELSNGRK